jgi:type IV pilus assembly protein PilV
MLRSMQRMFALQLGKNGPGFTLTEVLIAIVVLSLGFLGLSAMTIATTKGLSFSKRLTTATTLAQDKIEAIKHTTPTNVIAANYLLEDPIPGYPGFTRRVTVIPNSPSQGTMTVVVTTSWKGDERTSPHNVQLRTIVSK